MNASEARLRELLEAAPRSGDDLLQLLSGLDWPIPTDLDWEDVNLPWSLEELHLDPTKLAKLRRMSQIPPLTAEQKFGVFVLDFEGGRLPVGAIRRVVQRLVRSERSRAGGTHARWHLDDLMFFCLSDGDENALHVVSLREVDGKRAIRVLSWTDRPTPARMDLLITRGVTDLRWSSPNGPEIVLAEDFGASLRTYREGIRSAVALSKRMAEVARDVRDEIHALYEVEADGGPIRQLFDDVKAQLLSTLTSARFADVYAQTMVYGLLTARIAHPDEFKAVRSVSALRFDNEFLDAIYAKFREHSESALDVDELGLDDLAAQLAATDVDELLADFGSDNQRDDPVIYFYEDFLARYDPSQRLDLGAFFTPVPVVRYMVKVVDDALKSFGLDEGVADETTWGEYVSRHPGVKIPPHASEGDQVVSMFDPAGGTGTFMLEWIRRARANAGVAGERSAIRNSSATEISLASYAVSHLKVSLDLGEGCRESNLPIFLGDTLAPRRDDVLDGTADPISSEGYYADEVKFDWHHNVVIGNPPYDRVASKGTGGFIREPMKGASHSLFDDILDDAKKYTIFSHHASLYNQYVYFWRFAIWKAFEANSGPAVVSLITASSWLHGPGFIGLRRLAREVADEIRVVDLHGDSKGSRKDENVFDIESPVAIVTLIRRGATDRSQPAEVIYTSLRGTREDKLRSLSEATQSSPNLSGAIANSEWRAAFIPISGAAEWLGFPSVIDLFPWQSPGCKFNRTWPISPSRKLLSARWTRLLGGPDLADRATCFVTPSSGRNMNTAVGQMPPIADLSANAPMPSLVRYAYRSFDRQFCIADPRVIALERPNLWAAHTPRQIYLTTLVTKALGAGQSATVSANVPDLDHFSGRGGKDVIPLYRDAHCTPNVSPDVLKFLSERIDPGLTAERLFAYAFGVLAGTDYSSRFREELKTPGPRVPLSADPELFLQMAGHGERLIWLQTFGERMNAEEIPTVGVAWVDEPTRLPDSTADVRYDRATGTLHVADGELMGISVKAWEFEVSGMNVLRKWLGYRMSKPTGKAASSKSPLDHIRPTEWSQEWSTELVEIVAVLQHTLDMMPAGVELLDRIIAGPLIQADELPPVPDELRKPPKVGRSPGNTQSLF